MRSVTEPVKLPTGVKDSIFGIFDRLVKTGSGRRLVTKFVEVGGTSLGMGNYDESNTRTGENRLIQALAKTIPEIVALDVGANFGMWSRQLLKASPSATSIAVEPGAKAYESLVLLNQTQSSRIVPIRCAITDTDGEAELFGTDLDYLQASLNKDLLTRTTFEDSTRVILSEQVPTRTIESLGQELLSNSIVSINKKVNVLKVDTEGFEYEILIQALRNRTFTDFVAVQFEFNMHALAQGQTIDDFAKLFSPQFQLFRLAPRCLIAREEMSLHVANYFGFSNWVALHTSIAAKVVTEYAT